jgi:hypothetical protein
MPTILEQIETIPHQQETSKLIGKNPKTGNHILKVHILSNTENFGGNTFQYDDVLSIPKSFIEEVVGLPAPKEHHHLEFNKLYQELEKQGKTDCEIRHAMVEKSKELSVGILDDVYLPDKISYNSTRIPVVDLYGTLEITDDEENKYIEKHGAPSKPYTSIATFGPHINTPDGKRVYTDLNKVRPFHIALVDNPAFGKQKAAVRGVCRDEKSVCRNLLMYQSLDTDESINTDSNVINNMTNKSAEVQTEIPNKPSEVSSKEQTIPIVDAKINTPESITEKKEVPASVVKEEVPVKEEQKKESAPNKSEGSNNKELEELRAQLEQQRKEIEERKRTYRNDLLAFTLDPKAFKSEEELNAEKQNVMSIFEQYNFSDDHAKWLVTKAFPRTQSATPDPKKTTAYNSILYNSNDVAKSVPETASGANNNKTKSRNDLIELDY